MIIRMIWKIFFMINMCVCKADKVDKVYKVCKVSEVNRRHRHLTFDFRLLSYMISPELTYTSSTRASFNGFNVTSLIIAGSSTVSPFMTFSVFPSQQISNSPSIQMYTTNESIRAYSFSISLLNQRIFVLKNSQSTRFELTLHTGSFVILLLPFCLKSIASKARSVCNSLFSFPVPFLFQSKILYVISEVC